MCCLRRSDDLFICCIQPSVSDILHYGSLEKPGILQNHTEGIPQPVSVEFSDISSVQPDAAALHIIETHQKLHHCRLACASRPDDRNLLSRLYLCAEIMNDNLIRLIAKAYMLKADCSIKLPDLCRMLRCLLLLRLLQKGKNTFCSCCHGLYLIDNLRDLLNRLREIPHILDESLNISYRDHTADRQHAAGKRNACISKIAYKGHHRLHHARQELRLPCR